MDDEGENRWIYLLKWYFDEDEYRWGVASAIFIPIMKDKQEREM